MRAMIHPLSDVQSSNIGDDTRIWQFVVILPGAQIGNDCNICSHCLIENDVVIGNRVTVKSGVQLWDGLRSSGAVCLALASEPYDEAGYYREYRDFLAAVKDEA